MIDFKLIYKKITQGLSLEEEKVFKSWFDEDLSHQEYFYRVKEQIEKEKTSIHKSRHLSFVLKYGAAAAVAFLIGISVYNYSSLKGYFTKSSEKDAELVNTPIGPVNADATLVLADGTNVSLTKKSNFKREEVEVIENKVVYSDEAKKTNNLKSAFNTLIVPKGGVYELLLSDGSKAWLNSDSQLKYPVNFLKNQPRKVELVYGEVYFEVSPSSENNGTHFIVESNGQEIEVLGTHFNIKAYPNEDKQVTSLLEGSIKLSYKGNERMLKPNQRAIIFKDRTGIEIEEFDNQEDVLWVMGVFAFNNYTLEDISKVLMRWYDVEIVFSRKDLVEERFNGVFRKNQNLTQILDILSKSTSLNYRRNGKRIEIY